MSVDLLLALRGKTRQTYYMTERWAARSVANQIVMATTESEWAWWVYSNRDTTPHRFCDPQYNMYIVTHTHTHTKTKEAEKTLCGVLYIILEQNLTFQKLINLF